jgi:hypothetical protein
VHVFGRPLVDDKRLARMLGLHGNKWNAIKGRLLEVGAIKIEDGLLDVPTMIEPRSERETIEKRSAKKCRSEEKQ